VSIQELGTRGATRVHVLLITGAGEEFFSAGADIKMLEGANTHFKYDGAL
jgi:enoyl-CoA hydratase/carnithine racemase